jgi:hypothetical protein
MCLRRAPEKYIAGAALDRAGLNLGRKDAPLLPKLLVPSKLFKKIQYLKIFINISQNVLPASCVNCHELPAVGHPASSPASQIERT